MKKHLLTITCCIMFLLYIPFNTFAEFYHGEISQLNNITQTQLSKINELYYSHSNENLVIYYNSSNRNLYWSYDISTYNPNTTNISIKETFYLAYDGVVGSIHNENSFIINNNFYFIYLFYNGNTIFKNSNLLSIDYNNNLLLFSTSYDNVIRTRNTSAAASQRIRYHSIIDYDITHIIKGSNFDVYYLVNGTYKIIQKSVNTFSLHSHDSKSKFKDSSIENDYPDYPSIPTNSIVTYENQFTYGNFLFKITDFDTENLFVKAPDTDNLISDGNSKSQSATSNNNQSNQILDNTVNQIESLENGFKNDLNSNLDNINVNDFNISGITQLSNAANFVRFQFDNLTKNNPFGIILGFSLFIGLSLLIIGKRL